MKALLVLACLATALSAGAQDAKPLGPALIEERVTIKGKGSSMSGGESEFELAATVLRPAGDGPYGAVILNHGNPVSARARMNFPRPRFPNAAPVFARRGYVVVMPLRRGFGEAGSIYVEDAGGCARPDFRRAGRGAAESVMAAYEYVRSLPYVDGARIVFAGQSGGGFASLFAAAMHAPDGLIAVLNFAGGRGGNPETRPGTPCDGEQLAQVFGELGSRVKAPVLFHYAENDLYFDAAHSKRWYDAFTAAGGRGEYVLQPPFGRDGHTIFMAADGVRYWLPAVESFLGNHGIPFERLDATDPDRLLLLDLGHVPGPSCRGLYKAFLEAAAPRAFAVAKDGRCGYARGANAADRALAFCRGNSSAGCRLYAVDEEVVWK
jgi:dienelactone hydrolase